MAPLYRPSGKKYSRKKYVYIYIFIHYVSIQTPPEIKSISNRALLYLIIVGKFRWNFRSSWGLYLQGDASHRRRLGGQAPPEIPHQLVLVLRHGYINTSRGSSWRTFLLKRLNRKLGYLRTGANVGYTRKRYQYKLAINRMNLGRTYIYKYTRMIVYMTRGSTYTVRSGKIDACSTHSVPST